MKKILTLFFILVAFSCSAQVNWNFSAKKIAERTYEIHLTAKIPQPWHIYSQQSPEGGPVPTKITFNKNPLVVQEGKTKEIGKMKRKYEEVFNIYTMYYEDSVGFVQVIKLKNNIKTNIAGTIEYMTCNDHECMPPATEKFSIKLE